MEKFQGLLDQHTKNSQIKKRRGKKAYQKKLEEENNELKSMIKQLLFEISAKDAENKTMIQQLQFFQKQIGISANNPPSNSDNKETNSQNLPQEDEKSDIDDSITFDT